MVESSLMNASSEADEDTDSMMSKKCKYALKALIRLGQEYGGGPVLTDDIARVGAHSKKVS